MSYYSRRIHKDTTILLENLKRTEERKNEINFTKGPHDGSSSSPTNEKDGALDIIIKELDGAISSIKNKNRELMNIILQKEEELKELKRKTDNSVEPNHYYIN